MLLAVSATWASPESYLDYLRGLSEERAGHITKALDAYERVVQQDPQALEVFRDIAQLHLRLGHPEEALKAAERVKELAPKDPASYLFLGNVRVAQGNLAKAAEAYEEALKLDPQNLRAMENLGNYYAILDPTKALSHYQRYLDTDPNEPEIYFQMGLIHQKIGDTKRATAAYRKAMELDPQQMAPHLAMAEMFETQKSTKAAIEEYQQCIKLEPRNPILHMRLGHLFYAEKKWDEAASSFENVRALQPKDPSVYYWLARTSEEKRQWSQAAKEAQKAYELSSDPQFLPLTAYYLTLDHQIDAAIKWLEKARKVEPDNANVLLFLGMNYLDLNKPFKAKEALVRGVSRYPNDAQLRFQLGVTEERLGNLEDAAAQFKGVLAVDPKNAPAMNYLGYTWAEHGQNLEEAEKLLRAALALDPENGAYMDSLGWALYKRGALKESRQMLEKAAAKSPDALIFDHLGDVWWKLQEAELALKAWNQSLALDPKSDAVKKKAADAVGHVMKGTDQRKILKYIEGNARQINNFRATVTVDARWQRHPLDATGTLYYLRPNQMVLDVDARQAQGPRLIISTTSVRVEPPSMATELDALPLEELVILPRLISGDLLSPFDSSDVRTETKGKMIHYVVGAQQAWIDLQRGVLTRLTQAHAAGGQDEIEIQNYDLVEGVWLPSKMRLRNKKRGWEAQLTFSGWALNQKSTVKVFDSLPE